MPFSAKSLDFIFENYMNDSKVWFNDHKEDYKKYVTEPFAEVISGLTETMLAIDSSFVCDPKKISRLYRDARYSKGKSVFRDYVWYTFGRPRSEGGAPLGFYFSISPDGFDYGCGFYSTSSSVMETYRRLILEDNKSFRMALEAYRKQNVFTLYGDLYKRNKYPEESVEKQDWLNRKNIGLSCESKDFELLFSDRLIGKLAEDFKAIAPVYHFYLETENQQK
ncbi:MAG: DUF2461 domain-containing protein [Oscillospiraceae bacterium]|nr:DUF2461 domain-containing protein [Oscillospiraceae bacterium]